MNAPMEAKKSSEVKTWVRRVVEAAGVFRPANGEQGGRKVQGAGLAKSRHEALGKCLSLIAALADDAADEQGGTDKGGMGRSHLHRCHTLPRLFDRYIMNATLFVVRASARSGAWNPGLKAPLPAVLRTAMQAGNDTHQSRHSRSGCEKCGAHRS